MAAHNGKRLEQANINDQNKTNKQTENPKKENKPK